MFLTDQTQAHAMQGLHSLSQSCSCYSRYPFDFVRPSCSSYPLPPLSISRREEFMTTVGVKLPPLLMEMVAALKYKPRFLDWKLTEVGSRAFIPRQVTAVILHVPNCRCCEFHRGMTSRRSREKSWIPLKMVVQRNLRASPGASSPVHCPLMPNERTALKSTPAWGWKRRKTRPTLRLSLRWLRMIKLAGWRQIPRQVCRLNFQKGLAVRCRLTTVARRR